MSNIISKEEYLHHIQPEQARFYIQKIFANVIDVDPILMAEVRKIGKYNLLNGETKPCEQVSTAQLLQFGSNDPIPGLANWVAGRVIDAAPIGVGVFMAPALLNDLRATDLSVKRLVSVCVDFDTGNPAAKLEELVKRLGGVRPTILARSGGITAEGYHKLHAHFRLDEPCDEPWKVAYVREQIAKMFGADPSFKRIPQIIRIPGSLYDKDLERGRIAMVEIIDANEKSEIGLNNYEESLQLDFQNIVEDSLFNRANQTKTKEERQERKHALQTQEIHSGGTEETRFSRFSEYAGHQIRQARFGHQTEDEAQQSVHLWVQDKMVPAWDKGRVDAEFRALLQRDKVNHADTWAERNKPPITLTAPTPFNAGPVPVADPAQYGIEALADNVPQDKNSVQLCNYDIHDLYQGEAPPERHLVENFIVHGSMSALVADGGVGKTYATLELAARCAAGPVHIDGQPNKFMGFPVLEKMNVVVLTVEDGQHDIHRRLQAIDTDGSLRKAAHGSCSILPVREAIMDGLTLVGKDTQGNNTASIAWKYVIKLIEEYLQRSTARIDCPLLVVIDTYSATHHGDENNAVAVNEWFRAAGLLKKFDATLFMTHHIRKTDPKAEIRTVDDMKAAVRGSTAFMNSLRLVIGIWKMPNGEAVLKEMIGREPGQLLFNMGILKNNTGISWAERSSPKFHDPLLTLKRLGDGRLVYDDLTHRKRLELGDGKKERLDASKAHLRAAIRHAVQWYSDQGWPLSRNTLESERETLLPHPVNNMSKNEIREALEVLVNTEGSLCQVEGIKRVPRGGVLDVPEGAFAVGTQTERVPVRPKMVWAHFKYDDENECFNFIPNSQGAMDFGND